MAYRAVLRLSRKQQCTTYGRINVYSKLYSEQLPALSQERSYHKGNNEGNNGHQESKNTWGQRSSLGAGLGIATAVIGGLSSQVLLAEEKQDKKVIDKETRYALRKYGLLFVLTIKILWAFIDVIDNYTNIVIVNSHLLGKSACLGSFINCGINTSFIGNGKYGNIGHILKL